MPALLELLLPARCAGCGQPGSPCCGSCRREFGPPRPIRCEPLRGVPAFGLAAYRGAARQLVLGYKERGRRDLAPLLGGLLAAAVPATPVTPAAALAAGEPVILVPAPSSRAASRVRGGPHVLRLAQSCAAALAASGRPAAVAPALWLSRGVRDAVGLDAAHRAANVAEHLRVDPAGAPPAGSSAVLLDDVLTTGATAAACVAALRGIGVEVGAVIALTSPRLSPSRNLSPETRSGANSSRT